MMRGCLEHIRELAAHLANGRFAESTTKRKVAPAGGPFSPGELAPFSLGSAQSEAGMLLPCYPPPLICGFLC